MPGRPGGGRPGGAGGAPGHLSQGSPGTPLTHLSRGASGTIRDARDARDTLFRLFQHGGCVFGIRAGWFFSATVVHFHQDVVLGSNPFFVNFWLPQAPLRRDSIGLCRNVATAEFVRSSSSACYSRENAFASLKQFHRRAPIGIFRKVKTTISCNVFLRFFVSL